MNPVLSIALSIVAILATVAGWRTWSNHRDLERLRANGYHKIAARRRYQRGYIEEEFLKGIVEFIVLIALLIALFAFLGFQDPTT